MTRRGRPTSQCCTPSPDWRRAQAAVDETIRHQQRILDLDPWDEAAHVGIVRVMERAGRHGEARRYFHAYASRMNELGVPVEPFPLG